MTCDQCGTAATMRRQDGSCGCDEHLERPALVFPFPAEGRPGPQASRGTRPSASAQRNKRRLEGDGARKRWTRADVLEVLEQLAGDVAGDAVGEGR